MISSRLRDPACRTNPWDELKYIAFGENGDRGLTLGADARFVLINARNLSFGNEGGDNHNVFLSVITPMRACAWEARSGCSQS